MQTMRICPSCGSKAMSATPPAHPVNSPQGSSLTQSLNTGSSGLNTQSNHPSTNQSGVTFGVATTLEPAGHLNRFLASVIDSLIVSILSGIPIAIAYLVSAAKSSSASADPVSVFLILLAIIMPYTYYTIMHSSPKQATIGKSVMGLMILTTQGERLTKIQAFSRVMLTALVPVLGLIILVFTTAGIAGQYKDEIHASLYITLGLGILIVYLGPFMMVFFNQSRQTLFDLICKTIVVKKV
jgi:uncharacterized RDD family membrane protein YckC